MQDPIRVLVVDDESGLRRFLTKELSARGLTVEAAGSGEEPRVCAEAEGVFVSIGKRAPEGAAEGG